MLVIAVALFVGFKNLKINENKFINNLAGTMFGVYLLHDNFFVRKFLWIDFFKNLSFIDSPFLVIHAILAVFVVFVACSLVEYLRSRFIEKPFLKLVDIAWNPFLGLCKKIADKFLAN